MEYDYTTASPGADEFACHNSDYSDAAAAPPEGTLLGKNAKVPFARGRGTFFDEYTDLLDPEGAILTERLVEIYDKICPKMRKKGRETLRLRLRKLAANALRGHFFRDPPPILYYRGAAIKEWQDKPRWMKHGALRHVIDVLINAGLARGITGKKMPGNFKTKSWASSYWATDGLVSLAAECGITPGSIDRQIPTHDLVQLFAPKRKIEFDRMRGELIQPRKGKRIEFEPTAETQAWTATLEAINVFYRQQEIGLALNPAELELWLAKRNSVPDRKGAKFRLPEMFSTDIYRVFNNGNEADPKFDEGGRLFGGSWMYFPEDLRRATTINGKPTVELDYANCHPRMLYHQRGLPGSGDLYTVPEIAAYEAATGVDRGTYRSCIKWLMQILINGGGRPEAVEPPNGMLFPPDISIKQMVRFIETMHQPIADAFRSGAGLRLMRIESEIALEIVTLAMAEEWTVLPVHDSFITTIDQRDRLKAMMIDVYVSRLGREPVIKE